MNIAKLYFLFFVCIVGCTAKLGEGQYVYTAQDDNMHPTIWKGNTVVVDSTQSDFTYGDVVLLKSNTPHFIHHRLCRIVGLPGDRISIENNICVINGEKNHFRFYADYDCKSEYVEIYPNGISINIFRNYSFSDSVDNSHPVEDLEEAHYFVMPDNRRECRGSKTVGIISHQAIAGKVVIPLKKRPF